MRGLKRAGGIRDRRRVGSHPSWVRGLKLYLRLPIEFDLHVAPFMGAWIETTSLEETYAVPFVAPFMGAWIETRLYYKRPLLIEVAPFMGAWIETVRGLSDFIIAIVAPFMGAWIETGL